MDNRAQFDAWAEQVSGRFVNRQWLLSKWENFEGLEWPEDKIRALLQHISDGLALRSDDLLLDLGCGGGWISQNLRPLCRTSVGLDFSQKMLLNGLRLDPNGHFVCGDILRLPFANNTAERVLCYFVLLNFMEDRDNLVAFQEIWRVLKKGGQALIGQLPDQRCSAQYDQAKQDYVHYCEQHYELGNSFREVCRFSQKLFDKDWLDQNLTRLGIQHCFRESFNPFFRPGVALTVPWRFDVILEKA